MKDETTKACFDIIAGALIGVGKHYQTRGEDVVGNILVSAGNSIIQTMKDEVPDSGPPPGPPPP